MALKHALVWTMAAFGHFSGLRCTRNCRFLLVAQTSSVSRCGKKFPVLMDILGSFFAVGVSLLDLSGHMLQVNCRFSPINLFVEFWNLVLHLSMSSQERLLLNAAIPSSLFEPHHLAFLKCEFVLFMTQAPARSASQDDSHRPTEW